MFKNFFKIILNASIIVVIIITIQTKSENADCAKITKNNNSSNRNSGSNKTRIKENPKEQMEAAFFINTTNTRSQHARKRQIEALPHKAMPRNVNSPKALSNQQSLTSTAIASTVTFNVATKVNSSQQAHDGTCFYICTYYNLLCALLVFVFLTPFNKWLIVCCLCCNIL